MSSFLTASIGLQTLGTHYYKGDRIVMLLVESPPRVHGAVLNVDVTHIENYFRTVGTGHTHFPGYDNPNVDRVRPMHPRDHVRTFESLEALHSESSPQLLISRSVLDANRLASAFRGTIDGRRRKNNHLNSDTTLRRKHTVVDIRLP